LPRLRKKVGIYYVNSIGMKGITNNNQSACMSAQDVLKKVEDENYYNSHTTIKEAMIQFARYHVERALEEASENVYSLEAEWIKNSYPLDQIK
jgi:hypothetical protein